MRTIFYWILPYISDRKKTIEIKTSSKQKNRNGFLVHKHFKMNLLELAQSELSRSNTERKHPFRLFTFATKDDFPAIRTVVNRKFELDWTILFYTDSRTPKVRQIQKNEKVAALFYHPKKKLQIRIRGIAKLIEKNSKLFQHHFEKVKQSQSAKDYLTENAPGNNFPKEGELIFGEEFHFMPIQIYVKEIDILLLGKEKHERQIFTLKNEAWEMQRVVP